MIWGQQIVMGGQYMVMGDSRLSWEHQIVIGDSIYSQRRAVSHRGPKIVMWGKLTVMGR